MNQNNDDISRPEMDYYLNEDLCDVVFEVEGKRIPAPKQLLSMKSRIFRAMFSGNFRESEDKVIPIKDTTVEAFKTFILFIISDRMVLFKPNEDFVYIDFIEELFRLSDKYEVLRLSDKITDWMRPRIETSDLISDARLAFKYNNKKYMKTIIKFIKKNINEIIHINIEELSEINDCTNNRLFDVMTSDRVKEGYGLVHFEVEGKVLFLTEDIYDSTDLGFQILTSDGSHINGSFEAFKVLIGFLYFNRLIIEDKNDFNLIAEVYGMAENYSTYGLENAISADLQKRITFENMKPILRIIFDFKIITLNRNLFDFIETNIEDLVKSGVEECNTITEELDTEVEEQNKRGYYNIRPDHKTGIWKSCDFDLIRHILYVITTFEDSDLLDRVTVLLMESLTYDNIPYIYELVVSSGNEDLITNIETFVDNNIKVICRQKRDDLFGIN